MKYCLNQTPFHPLRDLAPVPVAELKAYFEWFLGNMGPRLHVWEEAVRSFPGYEDCVSTPIRMTR